MNHLANETSSYLKQHAQNPVDWYPWGEEALEKAHREHKPILLSIGYAACHWCHVMAHESFEDEETASIMNDLFINIKVDREERPDLDKIYQTAHYLLTQRSGGWPLTIFLTHDDLTPFYSGTYFPREPRYQLPAFKDVLKKLAEIYQTQPDTIRQQNSELLKILQQKPTAITNVAINTEPLKNALDILENTFDQVDGGFGGAPKFPQSTRLAFLMQYKSPIVIKTLEHMAAGGIYDQLAGGFFRYSVDAAWQIPHFEKMLYDNAQLLSLYAQASHEFDGPLFNKIAQETGQWIIDNMQSNEGGFYATLDADSEGKEGKYYIWNKDEVKKLLTTQEYAIIEQCFGLDEPPNFENEWQFHMAQSIEEVAKKLKITLATATDLFHSAKQKLLKARQQRIPPHLDKKILTAWNGLMIKGMLIAGEKLQALPFIDSGQRALTFIQQNLWHNQRLLASYMDGKATIPAYLDDYIFLIDALLTSLQVSWKSQHLNFAIDISKTLIDYFYDDNDGGFFFTAKDHEKLLYRPKTMMDEAIPSGNGVAVSVFSILGHLLGETRYLEIAEKILQTAWPSLEKFPAEHCSLLLGLNEFLNPSPIIIIRGEQKELAIWKKAVTDSRFLVFAIQNNEANLPKTLALRKPVGKTCAYICKGTQCSAATDDFASFKSAITNYF